MFHWYFTKPFSELSCHFLSKSKGGILDELRVSFKVSSRGEVPKCLFSFFILRWNFIPLFLTGGNSYRDGISSRQKRENSKRHFTIHRKDFIPGWNFTCKHPLIWDSVMTILCRNKINKFTIVLRLRIKYSKGLGYTFLYTYIWFLSALLYQKP